jgi:hypothetical protein
MLAEEIGEGLVGQLLESCMRSLASWERAYKLHRPSERACRAWVSYRMTIPRAGEAAGAGGASASSSVTTPTRTEPCASAACRMGLEDIVSKRLSSPTDRTGQRIG